MKWWWRRKLWLCFITLIISVCLTQLLSSIVVSIGFDTKKLVPDFMLIGDGGNRTTMNLQSPVLTVYGRYPRVSGDAVGIRGLQAFDCVRAIEGFPLIYSDKSSPVEFRSEKAFIELTSNCHEFIARHGYARYHSVTEEEARFPLAFNILLYKDVEQLHLLLRAIYRRHNSYCLHVDGYAAPQVLEATRRLAACLPNVFVASRLENVTYAGFSRLQADLNCMQDHWLRSSSQQTPWRYLINLPSQDFPLKSNSELVKILTIFNGSNDIEGITGNRMLKHRFTFKHIYRRDENSGRLGIVQTEEKLGPPPHNIEVVKGSAYGVFSRAFVDYVLHDQRAKDLLRWSEEVQSPDEYFWATLNHNPHLNAPGCYMGTPDKKPWLAVYASWPPRDICRSGKTVHGVCIFGVADLPQLVARRELFANKFYLIFQPETLHCLDQWLFNRTRACLPLDTFFYRQLPFIHH